MEIILIKALQLILCFALLVLLHEGGHFLFAKLFKTRVEKFSLFFDPWTHLFSSYDNWFRRLRGKQPVPRTEYKDEDGKTHTRPEYVGTEYTIGWLPLGGYVKISGMIDESMDKEQMKQPVKPWEFRAKPAWQRLLIMVGGVLMNLLTAFFIYAMILFTWGETYTPMRNMEHGFKFNERAQQLGFRDGDIILATNDATFERYDGQKSLVNMCRDISEATSATVLRDGKEVTFALPGDINLLDMLKEEPTFVAPLMPSRIDSVMPNSPAAKAGMQKGDQIINFCGTPLTTANEVFDQLSRMNDILAQGNATDSLRLRNATVVVSRAETGATDTLALQLDKDYRMGVIWKNIVGNEDRVTQTYGFFESFPAGVAHGWDVLDGYVSDLKYLFTKEGAQSVGSFVAIGDLFPAEWNWLRFWELTAFISLMLAFMNILPIPALDGGHVFFLLFEVITRRKPGDKFMERAQTVGMTLLLLLMAYAMFNDVIYRIL